METIVWVLDYESGQYYEYDRATMGVFSDPVLAMSWADIDLDVDDPDGPVWRYVENESCFYLDVPADRSENMGMRRWHEITVSVSPCVVDSPENEDF